MKQPWYWLGALLSGAAIALAALIVARYLLLPAGPAVWEVAVGGIAGLAGASWFCWRGSCHPAAPPPAKQESTQEPGLPWQVNRLFFFNTLHNAAALTMVEPARAGQVIEQFAGYLRMMQEMAAHPDTLVNLEIRCAAAFLAIERVRFGERLQVSEVVAPECLEAVVPGLILQPLVAYALRDGVELSAATVEIGLKAWPEKETLCLQVWHDGPGESDPERRSQVMDELGFGRLRRQLALKEGYLEIEERLPQGVRLTIRLPRRGAMEYEGEASEPALT